MEYIIKGFNHLLRVSRRSWERWIGGIPANSNNSSFHLSSPPLSEDEDEEVVRQSFNEGRKDWR